MALNLEVCHRSIIKLLSPKTKTVYQKCVKTASSIPQKQQVGRRKKDKYIRFPYGNFMALRPRAKSGRERKRK
jgi:hypothetical protein